MIRATLVLAIVSLLAIPFLAPLFVIGLFRPSRRAFALCFRTWAWLILRAASTRVQFEGHRPRVGDPPCFFMSNHQSAFDIPVLMYALNGDVRFLAKESLFRFPLFGWVIRRYGNVPVDRANPRVTLRRMETMLGLDRKHPLSLIAFPEGTRSRDGHLLPFHRGTMKIAQRTGLDVVPVTVDGAIKVNPRGEFRLYPGEVRVRFAAPIPAAEVASLSAQQLMERVRETIDCGLSERSRVEGVKTPDLPLPRTECE